MKDKLLYFPYINVPYESWIVRNLLYWDEIGAIVPMDYIHEPNLLQREMRELVSSQLVRQIIPGEYVYREENRFAQAFIKLLEDYKIPERNALSNFGIEFSSKIHVEKFGYQIIKYLKEKGLAREDRSPWYYVEPITANLFMTYLASFLANEDTVDMVPMTDNVANLATFSELYPYGTYKDLAYVEKMRVELLSDLFPMPVNSIKINEIVSFKERYGEMCKRFRKNLEDEIREISFIDSDEEKQWQLSRLRRNHLEKIKEIEARMKERNWGWISFGTLCGVSSAALPGVTAVATGDFSGAYQAIPGLAGAVYSIFEGRQSKQKAFLDSPLAYASYVKKTFNR